MQNTFQMHDLVHDDCMNISVERIKAWLKTYRHTREWLGSQVDVTKRTVDNWLSAGQPIPDGKLRLIQRLMDDDAAAEARRRQQLMPTAQVFSLEVDLPTFRAYNQAALAAEQTLEDWSISELNAAAEAYFAQRNNITTLPTAADTVRDAVSRVAESITSYGTQQQKTS